MESTRSDRLRDAIRGCSLVLLTATEEEAAPVREALRGLAGHGMATKRLYVGELATGALGPAPVSPRPSVTPAVRAVLAVGGCDKANTAHALTCILQTLSPAPLFVLQFGIAGALPARGDDPRPGVGDVVVATSEAYSDTGSSSPSGWLSAGELGLPIACVAGTESAGVFPLDEKLARSAVEAIELSLGEGRRPRVWAGPFVTASRVTGVAAEAAELAGRWHALAESMEGAAAAHICSLYASPFLEVRAISNLVTDRDRGTWQVGRAVAAAGQAALAVVAALGSLALPGSR